ncbi:MAG: hypothetical protein A2236_07660 [Bacteroidetes bacterium RIFOXYA2_FULL_33_7]|nr:MAG: hypothetical protein A2236_07660 [Bacteroidetes bacterium RIFOXYA2_FULL_33_7]
MKTKNLSKIVIVSFVMIFLQACESHSVNTDNSFELFKKNRMVKNDSIIINKVIPETKKVETVTKIEKTDEWSIFKTDIERKIISNDKKIKELKKNPNIQVKSFKRINYLETDNNNLRMQLIEYKENEDARWTKFKTEMNQDVSDINTDLREIQIAINQ